MTRAILYCRQSKTESPDDSLSLETQERLLRDLAASRGWEVAAVYVDADRRGWDESRPALAEALAHCERGGIAAVCVLDLSRLARRLRHQEQIVERLAALGVELVSMREPFTTAPLFRQIIGAFAEEETRQKSATWRRVLAGRAARGMSHGVIPYGYVKGEKGGPIEPEPHAAAIVAALFQNYAAGWNIQDLAVDLTRRGIPAPRGGAWWPPQTVAQILDNPVYAGMVTLNGERLPGAHEAIVDAETFAAVEARRAEGVRPLRHKPCSSWLEGRIWHACGHRMHLFCSPPRQPGQRPRFRCHSLAHPRPPDDRCCVRPQTVAAYLAEPVVLARLAADLARLVPVRDVIAAARAAERRQAPGAADLRKRLDADAARVAEARKRAEDLYLSGVRDRAWFDAQEATQATEAARIARELAALPVVAAPDEIKMHRAVLRDLAREVGRLTAEEVGPILAELGIVVVGAEGVRVVYRGRYAAHVGMGETAEGFLRVP